MLSVAAELERSRKMIATSRTPASDFFMTALLDSRLAPFVDGLHSARLGDSSTASADARRLSLVNAPKLSALLREMASTVSSITAAERGEFAFALAGLEQPLCTLDLGLDGDVAGTRFIRRYERGMLLDTLGRREEALHWYDSIGGVGWRT